MSFDPPLHNIKGYLKSGNSYINICNKKSNVRKVHRLTLDKLVLHRSHIVIEDKKTTKISYDQDDYGNLSIFLAKDKDYVLFHEYGHVYFGRCHDIPMSWSVDISPKHNELFNLYTIIDDTPHYIGRDDDRLIMTKENNDTYLFNFEPLIINVPSETLEVSNDHVNIKPETKSMNILSDFLSHHGWKIVLVSVILILGVILYPKPKKVQKKKIDLDQSFLRKLGDEF